MRAGLLLLLCGCRQLLGFEEVVTPTSDSAVRPDGELVPDAALCTELTSSCATPSVLRSCTALGELPVDTECNWGCLVDHCGALQPTGGAATAADLMVDSTLADISLTTGVINTDTGAITGVRPAGDGVRSGIGFEVRNGVGVFHFKKLSINGPISALGTHAVVLVANEEVVVSSTLVARGCTAGERSPGGSLGGAPAATGNGPGAGGAGLNDGLDGGGGGAGHAVAGGKGGMGGAALGGAGGAVYGTAEIPLISAAGGSGGGGGADASGAGGPGGGAIQLISNTSISISGGINAGGCGGTKGATADAGGGGGSGGTIVLEAPIVEIAGGLAVNGGGGGGGDGGTDGAPGQLAATEANGGTPGGAGGAGGVGAALGSSGAGQNANRGGGGGGGVGWIRITTRDGSALITGFTSPGLGSVTATAAAALVQ